MLVLLSFLATQSHPSQLPLSLFCYLLIVSTRDERAMLLPFHVNPIFSLSMQKDRREMGQVPSTALTSTPHPSMAKGPLPINILCTVQSPLCHSPPLALLAFWQAALPDWIEGFPYLVYMFDNCSGLFVQGSVLFAALDFWED